MRRADVKEQTANSKKLPRRPAEISDVRRETS